MAVQVVKILPSDSGSLSVHIVLGFVHMIYYQTGGNIGIPAFSIAVLVTEIFPGVVSCSLVPVVFTDR